MFGKKKHPERNIFLEGEKDVSLENKNFIFDGDKITGEKIEYIDPDILIENPYNQEWKDLLRNHEGTPKNLVAQDEDRLFEQDLDQNGIMIPIFVYQSGEKFTIMYGHRRAAYAKTKKKSEPDFKVPILRINKPKNKEDEKIRIVAENLFRLQLQAKEKFFLYAKLNPEMIKKRKAGARRQGDASYTNIAESLGIHRVTYSEYIKAYAKAIEMSQKDGRSEPNIKDFKEAEYLIRTRKIFPSSHKNLKEDKTKLQAENKKLKIFINTIPDQKAAEFILRQAETSLKLDNFKSTVGAIIQAKEEIAKIQSLRQGDAEIENKSKDDTRRLKEQEKYRSEMFYRAKQLNDISKPQEWFEIKKSFLEHCEKLERKNTDIKKYFKELEKAGKK